MKDVIHSMTQAFLDAPDFAFYENLTPPFGLYLFYLYNFIVSICISLPLLIAHLSASQHSDRLIQSSLRSSNGFVLAQPNLTSR